MKRNILLIGHRSFLGREIKKLISENENYRLFSLENYFLEKDIIKLNKEDFLQKYFSNLVEIDTVISCLHLHKKKFNYELELNLKVYKNILNYVKIKNVKKIIYISSVNVSEDSFSSYAYIKYQIENLFQNFKNFIVIRPSTIIKIDQNKKLHGGRDGKSFNMFEKFFKYNLPIPIIGNGKYLFTYCFIKDLVNFILFTIKEDNYLNKKINFFSGEFLDFNTFMDYIGKIKNKKVYKIYIPLFLINFLCKIKIFNKKNIDNLLNQKIYYNYCNSIKENIQINQLKSLIK